MNLIGMIQACHVMSFRVAQVYSDQIGWCGLNHRSFLFYHNEAAHVIVFNSLYRSFYLYNRVLPTVQYPPKRVVYPQLPQGRRPIWSITHESIKNWNKTHYLLFSIFDLFCGHYKVIYFLFYSHFTFLVSFSLSQCTKRFFLLVLFE